MPKEYLKMSDAFVHDSVEALERHIYAGHMSKHCCEYAAHAINSHDELVRQRDKLLDAMRHTLAMLRVTSHGPSAANKAEDMLHAAICSLGADHFPDAAKMVAHEGWQLVPVEPTSAMLIASGSTAPRYRAMLAAAPKHEGGAS